MNAKALAYPGFEARQVPHAVTMIRQAHFDEDVAVYLVAGSRDIAVLDTGLGGGDFVGLVASLSARRPRVLQTHLHWDHIGASHGFTDVLVHPLEVEDRRAGWPWQRFWPTDDASAQPAMGSAASGELTPLAFSGWLAPGDRIDLGGRVLDVLHTPGHSRGSVSFLDREARALFTGDLVYLSQMYLFVPGADLAAFRASLQLIAGLAAEVDVIYPAHGPTPIRPADALAIQAAFETVWAGRPRPAPRTLRIRRRRPRLQPLLIPAPS